MFRSGCIAVGALFVALFLAGTPGHARASVEAPGAARARVLDEARASAARVQVRPVWRISRRAHHRHSASRGRRAALHRAHVASRHRLEIARRVHARAAAARDLAVAERGSAASIDASASVIGRPPPSCGIRGAAACRTPAEAEHALVLENRRAMAAGVSAVVLREGFDDWRDLARRAEARSPAALDEAYRIRTAFVEDAIERRGGLSRGVRAVELGIL